MIVLITPHHSYKCRLIFNPRKRSPSAKTKLDSVLFNLVIFVVFAVTETNHCCLIKSFVKMKKEQLRVQPLTICVELCCSLSLFALISAIL